jgi:hypothetical protein
LLNVDNHQLVYSSEVLEFASCGNAYIRRLESGDLPDRSLFIPEMLALLTSLYAAFIRIPANEPYFDDGNEKFVSEEEWSEVYTKMTIALGRNNDYLDIPDEEEYDRSELVRRKISEDLADIYQDIKDFLELYRVGTEEVMNDALWECRMNFENSWGQKTLRAAAALHSAYKKVLKGFDGSDTGPDDFNNKINTDNWFISMRQREMGGESELPE